MERALPNLTEDRECDLCGRHAGYPEKGTHLSCQYAEKVEHSVHFAVKRDEGEESEEEDIPEWRGGGDGVPNMGVQLSESQKVQIRELLDEFREVMSSKPGRTSKAVHNVQLTDQKPVRLAPYRLPHAYRELVRKERDR